MTYRGDVVRSGVAELTEYLDRVEAGAEQMLTEVRRLRRSLAVLDGSNQDRLFDLRVELEQLLCLLGGPSGMAMPGVIDEMGQPVSFASGRGQRSGSDSAMSPPVTPPAPGVPPPWDPPRASELFDRAPVAAPVDTPPTMPPPVGAPAQF